MPLRMWRGRNTRCQDGNSVRLEVMSHVTRWTSGELLGLLTLTVLSQDCF
jgi:hypothetical protein